MVLFTIFYNHGILQLEYCMLDSTGRVYAICPNHLFDSLWQHVSIAALFDKRFGLYNQQKRMLLLLMLFFTFSEMVTNPKKLL